MLSTYCCFTFCFFLDVSLSIRQNNQVNEVISKEDYAIYLDGQKIDLSNININDYNIIIDDDNKKIILSNKR